MGVTDKGMRSDIAQSCWSICCLAFASSLLSVREQFVAVMDAFNDFKG